MVAATCSLRHAASAQLRASPVPSPRRLLWGLAQLGFCPTLLLGAVAARLLEPGVLPGFAPHELATTTYTFAVLDFYPGGGRASPGAPPACRPPAPDPAWRPPPRQRARRNLPAAVAAPPAPLPGASMLP